MLSRKLGVVFALSPILGIYTIGIPILSLSQILLICLSFICLLFYKKKVKVIFRSFIVYAIIISVIRWTEAWVIISDSFRDILSLLLFYFVLIATLTYADYEVFKKTIIKMGIVSLLFFILQYVLSLVGIRISGIIPFLPLSNEVPTGDFIIAQLRRDRLCGLFEEPAHYSEFMIIVLTYVLYSMKITRKMLLLAILISISMLLTNSATGFAMICVIWSIWMFIYYIKHTKYKIVYLTCLSVVVALLIVFAVQNDTIMNMVGRFNELNGEVSGEHGRSSYIRVVRGYIPFSEGDFNHKLFGNGLGTLLGYVKSHPHTNYLLLSDFNPKWVNGLQYLLFTTGIIGCLLYLSQILRLYLRTTIIGKMFVICLILMFLSSDSFFSVGMLLYIVVMEMIYKRSSVESCK